MSRASSAQRSRAVAAGNRGVASGVLRALFVSRFFGGRKPSAVGVATLIGVLFLLAAPSAQATKYFDSFFGGTSSTPATGGLFGSGNSGVGDVAVNDPLVATDGSAHAGWVYVADRGNHRIQAFDQDGVFQFAIGRNVTTDGSPSDPTSIVGFQKCTVAADCKAGVAGSLAGEFNILQGIDIDQATGHIFVAERTTNRRVQEFTADGTPIRAFGWDVVASGPGDTGGFETCNTAAGDVCKASGAAGSAAGQFGSGTPSANHHGVAVAPPGAPNAGQVYVTDPGNARIQRFTVPSGAVGAVTAGVPFGRAAVATDGDDAFHSSGWPRSVAAGADGVVYGATRSVAGSGVALVIRFDTPTEAFLSRIAGGSDTPLGSGGVDCLGVDPGTDNLLVCRSGVVGIMEFDLSGKPQTVDSSHLVDTHAAGLSSSTSTFARDGLAVDPASGRLYFPTNGTAGGTGTGNRVIVLDDSGVDPPPTVDLLPPTNVGCSSATLQTEINPNGPTGFATSYRFQVSKTGVEGDWVDVEANQLVGATGDGSDPVFISDQAEGLEANTFYRVRVRTQRDPAAGVAISAELTFLTDPCPPTVESGEAQQVTDSSAQLVGRVNPNGLETTYWFEWGDDNYGNTIPVPAGSAGSGSVVRAVSEALTGLTANRLHHFRFCVRNALSPEPLCTGDRTFTTRSVVPAPKGRGYEMVTPPDKPLRRGGDSRNNVGLPDVSRAQAGVPSPDGESVMWRLFAGATDFEAGHAMTFENTYEVRRRTGSGYGWRGDAVANVPPLIGSGGAVIESGVAAADFSKQSYTWSTIPLFSFGRDNSRVAIRAMGDDGGPRGGGWYPFLDAARIASPDDPTRYGDGPGMFTDAGDRLLSVGDLSQSAPGMRTVTGVEDALPPQGLTPPQTSGGAMFVSTAAHAWQPGDLVNECTGAGGSATLLPERDDSGTEAGPPGSFTGYAVFESGSTTLSAVDPNNLPFPAGIQPGHFVTGAGIAPGTRVVSRDSNAQLTVDLPTVASSGAFSVLTIGQNTANFADDTIRARPCEEGSPTDVRGAALSDSPTGPLASSQANMMSEDGSRVFFVSPDPTVGGDGQRTCGNAISSETACPAQLFVRSYGDDGQATVRWLSRAEDALFDAPQRVGAFGNGVAFEGAAKQNGRVVYFRTNAPLTADDPNGGLSPTEAASAASWDLYRYELPADSGDDPAPPGADPADRLTRISGGPDGTADPNTNCTSSAANCGGTANGAGAAVRFMSDDGNRVYFVTAARIPGASNAPANGGTTSPTAPDVQVNAGNRNLYLYDASKSGAAAYEFVAQIPFSPIAVVDVDAIDIDACASSNVTSGGSPHAWVTGAASRITLAGGMNCVHGTTSGDAVVFETAGRLTADDMDDAIDVYLYDAVSDELVRLSAPQPASSPYLCVNGPGGLDEVIAHCNADLGMLSNARSGSWDGGNVGTSGLRHWNIAHDSAGRLEAVYFESRLPLIDADADDLMDVYEWRRGDGRLSLVTPGTTERSAFYSGNSSDGEDVFFATEQRLSAWEIDQFDGDLYNARIGSNLPGPPALPPVCGVLGGACHGGGAAALAVPPAQTSPSSARRNASAKRLATLSVARLGAKARRRAARKGVLALRVRTTVDGRLSLTARATVGGRKRVVGRAVKRFARPGVARVRVKLNRNARRALGRGRTLRVSIGLHQAGARPRSIAVRLTRSK